MQFMFLQKWLIDFKIETNGDRDFRKFLKEGYV